MKKEYRKTIKRRIRRGWKLLSMSMLSSAVVLWAPFSVCHVSASGTMRFATCLLTDADGNLVTDGNGQYIEIFDEQGRPLFYNEDVAEYFNNLKEEAGEEGGQLEVVANEVEFFLIDGRLYRDVAGTEPLDDLSTVMPAVFKFNELEGGYTIQSDTGSLQVMPITLDGDSVYAVKESGDDSNLPAFTMSGSGAIGYLERGSIGQDDHRVAFVYDQNYFYDENMSVIADFSKVVPEEAEEDAPMFTGYYMKNGDDRRQIVDIDGALVMSSADYSEMVGGGAVAEDEYCNVVVLTAAGADPLTIYADMEDGTLYQDYQRTEAFENIGGQILSQLSYDKESNDDRGHFAGYYMPSEDGESLVQVIDDSGNLVQSIEAIAGKSELPARFYHIVTVGGEEECPEVYSSDGKIYLDKELITEAGNITDLFGEIPADEVTTVYSDDEDEEERIEGRQTKYFLGYYFASDFGIDEDEEEENSLEVLESDYEEGNFNIDDVEINRVKFAGRDGSIVYDGGLDGDVAVYQYWYTVTVWPDGETTVGTITDEPDDVIDDLIDEITEDEAGEENADGTEENTEETTEENTEENTGENTGENCEENTDTNTEENTGDNAGENTDNQGEGSSDENAEGGNSDAASDETPAEDQPTDGNEGQPTDGNEGQQSGDEGNSSEEQQPAENAEGQDEQPAENTDDQGSGDQQPSGDDQVSDDSANQQSGEAQEDNNDDEDRSSVQEDPAPATDQNGVPANTGDSDDDDDDNGSGDPAPVDADVPSTPEENSEGE